MDSPLSSVVGTFCLRLVLGMVAMLALLPQNQVEVGFFRRRLYLVFGLSVTAAVLSPGVRALAVTLAVASYFGSVAWYLEKKRLGFVFLGVLVILSGYGMVADFENFLSRSGNLQLFAAAAALSSSLVLGAALVSMLLGHEYLVRPGMSLAPLKRLLVVLASCLVLRGVLAMVGLVMSLGDQELAIGGMSSTSSVGLIVARLVLGVAGPLVMVALAWQTVRMRSTQSATGILYATVALTFFGELAAQLWTSQTGILL